MANASWDNSDRMRDECGIFAIFGHPDAAALAALSLHALQHRGQESAGIVTYDGSHFNTHRALGLVGDIFGSEKVMTRLKGDTAVGHVRYSTTGGTLFRNVQPLFAEFAFGGLAMAHNGNLTNTWALRRALVDRGSIFQSTADSEVLIHLIATSTYSGVIDRFIDALNSVVGAYSLVALTDDAVIGMRDPLGVRPLVLGTLDGAHILASESCALDIIGAHHERDVKPGEIIVIDRRGVQSLSPFAAADSRFCIFEYIYFARPDSLVEGINVYQARKRIGAELAAENPVDADICVAVPDSGTPAAIGYADAASIPFEIGIVRNHYVGRTFIEPGEQIRHLGVKLKHNANRAYVEGKRVVLVDDSVVRGTTSRKIKEMILDAGAAEVHFRIASPPTAWPCFYGVDTPQREKLLAATMSEDEMRDHLQVDSLKFISLDGLYRAVGEAEGRKAECPQYCDACFSGDYPVTPADQVKEGFQMKPAAE